VKRLLVLLALVLAACSADKPAPDQPVSAVAEVDVPGQPPLHSHGDDRLPPKPPALAAQTPPQAAWPCEGDGTTGRRVQFVYGHPAGGASLSTLRPALEGYAKQVEGTFLTSAQATGGSRLVRFVTDNGCALSIVDVTLSPTGIATLNGTISELSVAGLNRPDRIYHAWVDAAVYCGIGTVQNDDRAAADNASETRAGYSRSDRSCWGYAEPHEIVHNMGGVQLSAPHSTGGWHCFDEYDLMCYADGGPTGTMTFPCTDPGGEDHIDCNHDDFFSTAPPAGSYLATHWNVANSSALSGSTATTLPPPSSTTSTTVPPTTSTTIGAGKTTTNLAVPSTIHSGVSFTATATASGACGPTGTVAFYVSGNLLARQSLASGVSSVNLTITGGAARPTIRAEYGGSTACAASSDTSRPRLR
jgi:hypothetical protein